MLFDDLQVIVVETHGAKTDNHHHQQPDVGIFQVGPEEGAGEHGADYHEAAHGGGAGLGIMRLGAFLPDVLADLHLLEFFDAPRADDQGDDQGGEDGGKSPEGEVTEDVKRTENRF